MISIIVAIFVLIIFASFMTVFAKSNIQGITYRLAVMNILTFLYTFTLISLGLSSLNIMSEHTYIYVYIAIAVVLVSIILAVMFKNVRFINLWVISVCLLLCPLIYKPNFMMTIPLISLSPVFPTSTAILKPDFFWVYVGLAALLTIVSVILAQKYNKNFLYLLILPVSLLLASTIWPDITVFLFILTPIITITILNTRLLNYLEQKTELSEKKYREYKTVFEVIHLIFAIVFFGPCLIYFFNGLGILLFVLTIMPYFVMPLFPIYFLVLFYNSVFNKISIEKEETASNRSENEVST